MLLRSHFAHVSHTRYCPPLVCFKRFNRFVVFIFQQQVCQAPVPSRLPCPFQRAPQRRTSRVPTALLSTIPKDANATSKWSSYRMCAHVYVRVCTQCAYEMRCACEMRGVCTRVVGSVVGITCVCVHCGIVWFMWLCSSIDTEVFLSILRHVLFIKTIFAMQEWEHKLQLQLTSDRELWMIASTSTTTFSHILLQPSLYSSHYSKHAVPSNSQRKYCHYGMIWYVLVFNQITGALWHCCQRVLRLEILLLQSS